MDIVKTEIMIVGGDNDPCLQRLLAVCREFDVPHKSFLVGQSGTPKMFIDIKNDNLIINDKIYKPKSVFIRPNAFNYVKSGDYDDRRNAKDWFDCFLGWAAAGPDIKLLNKGYFNKNRVNKIQALYRAQELGLKTPDTFYTNDIDSLNKLAATEQFVEKPVDSGDGTKILKARDTKTNPYRITPVPLTVQKKLDFPEMRLFKVGEKAFAYKILSQHVDYRQKSDISLEPMPVPDVEKEALFRLCEEFCLDYAAADFKTDPETGEWIFLEVNSGPMFIAFDYVVQSALCMSMVEWLTGSTFGYQPQ